MVGASKILTVSYGTFSCTLEGFEDPFTTMKAIAEYFRDLAADDRYFGAEPPTPDAEMLHRIAEREIQRRVEAKISEHGIVLRADGAAPSDVVAEAPAPLTEQAAEPVAAPAASPITVANTPIAAIAAAPVLAALDDEDTTEAAGEVAEETAEEIPAEDIAEEFVTDELSEEILAADDLLDVDAPAPAADPFAAVVDDRHFDTDSDSIAAKLMRIRAVVAAAQAAPVEAAPETFEEAAFEEEEPAGEFGAEATVPAGDFGFELELDEMPVRAESEDTAGFDAFDVADEDGEDEDMTAGIEAAPVDEVPVEEVEELADEPVQAIEADDVIENVEAAEEASIEEADELADAPVQAIEAEDVIEGVDAPAEASDEIEFTAASDDGDIEEEDTIDEDALLRALDEAEAEEAFEEDEALPVEPEATIEAEDAPVAEDDEMFFASLAGALASEPETEAEASDAGEAAEQDEALRAALTSDDEMFDEDTAFDDEEEALEAALRDDEPAEADVAEEPQAAAPAAGGALDLSAWRMDEDTLAAEAAAAEAARETAAMADEDADDDSWIKTAFANQDAEMADEAPEEVAEAPRQGFLARARARLIKIRRPAETDMSEPEMSQDVSVEETADAPVEEMDTRTAPAEAEAGDHDAILAALNGAEELETEEFDDEVVDGIVSEMDDADKPVDAEDLLKAFDDEEAATAEAGGEAEEADDAALLAGIGEAIGATGLDTEDEQDLLNDLANVARESRRDSHEGRAILESDAVAEDSSVERLMEEAKSKLEGVESRRRFSAISHLKAAVAATVADRKLKSERGDDVAEDDDSIEQYRDDLSKAVRPRRPVADGAATTRRPTIETRPAPLVLISEQRVSDEPDGDSHAAAAVRPRRISAGNAAVAVEPEEEVEDQAPVSPEEAKSFAEFAERLGATNLSEMLEAAAAYTATVEGQPHFSRPHILRKVARMAENDDYNREDGLRSFGMLLRQGKIQKISRGQFTISEASRFMTEARRSGE